MIAAPDVPDVYLVPETLQAEGLDTLVCEKLGLDVPAADLGEWRELTERSGELREEVEIALVGKYVKLHDAYLSVHEALKHGGVHAGAGCVSAGWMPSTCPTRRRSGSSSRWTVCSCRGGSDPVAGKEDSRLPCRAGT